MGDQLCSVQQQKAADHDPVNLGSRKSSSLQWVREKARTRSASISVRIVSESGVRHLSHSRASRSKTNPRTTTCLPRKLPPKAPDCRREASADAVRAFLPGISRPCGLEARVRSTDECGPTGGDAYSDAELLHIHSLPLRERAE